MATERRGKKVEYSLRDWQLPHHQKLLLQEGQVLRIYTCFLLLLRIYIFRELLVPLRLLFPS